MVYIDLEKFENDIRILQKEREECKYTGVKDLSCVDRIRSIRRIVKDELIRVRAQLEVCPIEMIYNLKTRENELLEWLHRN